MNQIKYDRLEAVANEAFDKTKPLEENIQRALSIAWDEGARWGSTSERLPLIHENPYRSLAEGKTE